ncbi:MAG TPA: succinyl-diaminopimelate desuccinylase [Polyangiaceae bacterium]|nr:succinyl-diaminopimelate desuccinylase [Polyangiaceae bacterium]
MTDLAETLLWLCRIPSLIGEERALCDAVVERLSHIPLAAPVRRYGDSIVVPLVRGTGKPHVVLAGHLDVVRTVHDSPPRIEGDKLYGAGAADMKSGLALMFDIAETLPHPALDLTLIFYAREEGPYAENELGPVLAQDPEVTRADLAIALEPSDNKLQLGCGGSLHATVAFVGRTAHSARPWQGENAIHKAASFLARLGAVEPVSEVVDGLEWKSVVSATMASGGRARNVIPDRFELNLNHRFGPGTSIAQAQANIERLVAGEAELTFTDLSPSAPPSRENPLVRALAESGVLAIEPKQAWTDVARFHASGVPAANFGPGTQAQAHQRNEWTHIPGLAVGQGILRRFLAKVGGLATLALVLSIGAVASGCENPTGAAQRRSEVVADAMPNTRTSFERAEVRRWLASVRRAVGSARVLMLDVREHQVTVQYESKVQPGSVLETVIEDGQSSEPARAEIRGTGDLVANLFALGDVQLDKIPEVTTTAATQVDAQDGRITRVLVRRQLPHTDAVRLRVYVESPRLSGYADFDPSGNLIGPAGSHAEL